MVFAQFKLCLPVFFSLCLLVTYAQAEDVNYCNKKAEYDVKVSGVDITPHPVARGQPATFSISASTGEEISGGKLFLDVSYFGFPVHSETHDLCQETSCPILAGNFVISHTQELPGFAPPGSYTLTLRMEDGNKHQLTCIVFDFSIGLTSSVAEI
ncbi:uncharacterized protein LOC131145105 [Malania oleifera]|uniref:uncharacterized protein LOC131145105 n=1 Tax=Malania oleifera TaxID=397392 RepID=UPI0025AE6085|nr:uncharacterized protein LOC131145105 [Malania oleifera]